MGNFTYVTYRYLCHQRCMYTDDITYNSISLLMTNEKRFWPMTAQADMNQHFLQMN